MCLDFVRICVVCVFLRLSMKSGLTPEERIFLIGFQQFILFLLFLHHVSLTLRLT